MAVKSCLVFVEGLEFAEGSAPRCRAEAQQAEAKRLVLVAGGLVLHRKGGIGLQVCGCWKVGAFS